MISPKDKSEEAEEVPAVVDLNASWTNLEMDSILTQSSPIPMKRKKKSKL